MGFASHIRDQINRDKLTKQKLNNGGYFRLKKKFLEASKKAGIELQKATPGQMKAIKLKIKNQKVAEGKKKMKVFAASVVFGIILFFGISWIFKYVFF